MFSILNMKTLWGNVTFHRLKESVLYFLVLMDCVEHMNDLKLFSPCL